MSFLGEDQVEEQDPQKAMVVELKRLVEMVDRLVVAVERMKDDLEKVQRHLAK